MDIIATEILHVILSSIENQELLCVYRRVCKRWKYLLESNLFLPAKPSDFNQYLTHNEYLYLINNLNKNKTWDSLLSHAFMKNNDKVILMALCHDAVYSHGNDKILIWAFKKNNFQIVNLFLDRNKYTKSGLNEIFALCCKDGLNNHIQKLFNYGPDIHDKDNRCLRLASGNGHESIVKFLIDIGSKKSFHAIKSSVEHGHTRIVIILLDAFTYSVHEYNDIFMSAIKKELVDVVKYLLDRHQINLRSVNDIGSSVLVLAVSKGNFQIVNLLLENGTDAKIDNDMPLRIATTKGFDAIAKLLIEYGANIHVNNDEPLISSVTNCHYDVVKLLLENGADPNIEASRLICDAAERGFHKIIEILVKFGGKVNVRNNSPLIVACRRGYEKVVEILLNNGADIHVMDDEPLRSCFDHEKINVKLVKLLLDKGANIHTRNDQILHFCLRIKRYDILTLLMTHVKK